VSAQNLDRDEGQHDDQERSLETQGASADHSLVGTRRTLLGATTRIGAWVRLPQSESLAHLRTHRPHWPGLQLDDQGSEPHSESPQGEELVRCPVVRLFTGIVLSLEETRHLSP